MEKSLDLKEIFQQILDVLKIQNIIKAGITAILVLLLVGGVIGFSAGYLISQVGLSGLQSQLTEAQSTLETYETQISTLQTDLNNAQNNISDCQAQIASLQAQLSQLQSGMADLPEWLDQLANDLQADTTDQRPYIEGVYENEHYARDLQDNLEALGYEVRYVIAFQFDNTLQYVPLVGVRYSTAFAVLVNPRTDEIVTPDYDGDGDNSVAVLTNPSRDDAFNKLEDLIDTGQGNDGEYLILAFEDYETVDFVNTAVGCMACLEEDLEEDTTDEGNYVQDTHDCDDFAKELEDALEAKGWRVTIKIVWWKVGDEKRGHAVVNVHGSPHRCGVEIPTTTIEPQTDEDVTDTYDDDGDGTVESASPGRVRAEVWLFGFCHDLPFCGGTDGKYLIFEYEDFDDIPFPVD